MSAKFKPPPVQSKIAAEKLWLGFLSIFNHMSTKEEEVI